jgi:hypothetical protein
MKTKLIALVALALVEHAFLTADVAAGAEFEVDADHAEGLLTAGKAKLAEATPATPKTKTVKARVLADCCWGKPNDVADIPADQAKAAEKEGIVDTDKAAVAYAAGLEQNRKQG